MKHALESPLKAIPHNTKAKVIVKDILLVTFNNIHLITLSFLPYKVFCSLCFYFLHQRILVLFSLRTEILG